MNLQIDFEKLRNEINLLFHDQNLPLYDYGVYLGLRPNGSEIITVDWHYRNSICNQDFNQFVNFDLDFFGSVFFKIIENMNLELLEVGISIFIPTNEFHFLLSKHKNYTKEERIIIKDFIHNGIRCYIQIAQSFALD